MISLAIPLLVGLVGGPIALAVRIWYKKRNKDVSSFQDSGTYVRDDNLYSYDKDPNSKNNS